jgi:hypothetical protein
MAKYIPIALIHYVQMMIMGKFALEYLPIQYLYAKNKNQDAYHAPGIPPTNPVGATG